jgi:hypothetical protein
VVESGHMGDRTLLSLRALCKIYLILAKKIEYEGEIQDIKNQILVKGETLAAHILNQTRIICKFAQPHFREGMVSLLLIKLLDRPRPFLLNLRFAST